MKKLITVIFFISSVLFCEGQIIDFNRVIDSLNKNSPGWNSLSIGDSTYYSPDPVPVVFDTVKVILMVSDTAIRYSTSSHSYPYQTTPVKIDTTAIFTFDQVYWMQGYEVREWTCCKDMPDGSSGFHTSQAIFFWNYTHLYYIDADKKPLSGNIIVWMSK